MFTLKGLVSALVITLCRSTSEVPTVPVADVCEQWGICGQECVMDNSTENGYSCMCKDGYFMEPDEFTCTPLGHSPSYVVFMDRHSIHRLDTSDNKDVLLRTGLRHVVPVDFYYKGEQLVLVWADVITYMIYRGTMVDNELVNVEAIVTSGIADVEGIAADWVTENIYWTDKNFGNGNGKIQVSKVDGTKLTVLIADGLSNPRAISVDPTAGLLFWTDWDTQNPRVERCSMNGDHRRVVHQVSPNNGGWVNGLTLDYDFQRVYWLDAKSDTIHTVTYTGEDHRLVLNLKDHNAGSHPFSMTLFGNFIYWTDWITNSVFRANKFNGSDAQVVITILSAPFGIQAIHPMRHPYRENPCAENNGGCPASMLCLLKDSDGNVDCKCPDDVKGDDKSCPTNNNKDFI